MFLYKFKCESEYIETIFNLGLLKHWKFIDQFCQAFEPMFNLTIRLQKTHVPLSQFYTEWLVCQAHLSAVSGCGNKLAKKLLSAMQERIIKLSSNAAFKACLYVDPRYNFLGSGRLSADDKSEAQVHLRIQNVICRINFFSNINFTEVSTHSQQEVG